MKVTARIKKFSIPYFFIAPCALLIGLILLYPLARGIVSSFYNVNLLIPLPSKFVGLENFIRLFKDNLFWTALTNSIIWTVVILVAQMAGGLGVALLLNQKIKGRRFFRSLILIPWVIPAAIGAITWRWIYAEQYGLLNFILYRLHIIDHYKAWLAEPSFALPAVIVVAIWKGIPFVTIVLLAGLQSIPQTLYEAARIDGAGAFPIFWRITLPLIKSIALIVALLTSIWTFNHFETVQIMTRGGPGTATLLMPIYAYKLFLESFQISYASTLATAMLGLMMVLAYFYVRRLM